MNLVLMTMLAFLMFYRLIVIEYDLYFGVTIMIILTVILI